MTASENGITQAKSRLGETRRIKSLGLFEGTTERRAVEIFRSFTINDIEPVISKMASDANRLQPVLRRVYGSIKFWQEAYPGHPYPPAYITQMIDKGMADIFGLHHLLFSWGDGNGDEGIPPLTDVDSLIEASLPKFAEIVDMPSASLDELLEKALGKAVEKNLAPSIELGLIAGFTPVENRAALTEDLDFEFNSLRSNEQQQILDFTPDLLSGNDTPEKRFDAFTRMLTYTHEDALTVVYKLHGISDIDQLKTTDFEQYKSIQRQAGLLYARTNFYGVLEDFSGDGYGSVFKVHPETHGGPSRTERERCVANSFVNVYLQSLGRALQANKDTILPVISTDYLRL